MANFRTLIESVYEMTKKIDDGIDRMSGAIACLTDAVSLCKEETADLFTGIGSDADEVFDEVSELINDIKRSFPSESVITLKDVATVFSFKEEKTLTKEVVTLSVLEQNIFSYVHTRADRRWRIDVLKNIPLVKEQDGLSISGSTISINEIVNDLTESIACSDVIKTALECCISGSTSIADFANIIKSMYAGLSGDAIRIFNDILVLVPQGPAAIVEYVRSLYNNVGTIQSREGYFEFANSAWKIESFQTGMVVGIISTVTSIVGAVVTAISPIIGFGLSALGQLVTAGWNAYQKKFSTDVNASVNHNSFNRNFSIPLFQFSLDDEQGLQQEAANLFDYWQGILADKGAVKISLLGLEGWIWVDKYYSTGLPSKISFELYPSLRCANFDVITSSSQTQPDFITSEETNSLATNNNKYTLLSPTKASYKYDNFMGDVDGLLQKYSDITELSRFSGGWVIRAIVLALSNIVGPCSATVGQPNYIGSILSQNHASLLYNLITIAVTMDVPDSDNTWSLINKAYSLFGWNNSIPFNDTIYGKNSVYLANLYNSLNPNAIASDISSEVIDLKNLLFNQTSTKGENYVLPPVSSVSAYVFGIVVDALIVAAVVAATIVTATKGRKALAKQKAKVQARTAQAWDNLQKNPTTENFDAYYKAAASQNRWAPILGCDKVNNSCYWGSTDSSELKGAQDSLPSRLTKEGSLTLGDIYERITGLPYEPPKTL